MHESPRYGDGPTAAVPDPEALLQTESSSLAAASPSAGNIQCIPLGPALPLRTHGAYIFGDAAPRLTQSSHARPHSKRTYYL
jgi:hypothetical protein